MRGHRRLTRGPWKRAIVSTALAGLLLGSAACGGGDGGGSGEQGSVDDQLSEQGDPVDGGSLTMGLDAETDSWLPGDGTFAAPGTTVAYSIYDPLMRRSADGEVRPYLAESMEANEDLTVWTLTLRPDITFHDGTDLNAQALKTIWDEYLTIDTSNTQATLAEVTSMDVVDDLTVTYTLEAPNAAFPDVLTASPGWPFSPTAAKKFGEDAGANPVGTGPFKFVSWQRDSQLVVEKNEDYWQEGLPHLDEVTFRVIPDEDTRLASLQSGDIDAMMSLTPSTVVRARDVEGVDSYEFLGNTSNGSVINTSRAPLDDVRLRQALVMAVDQVGVIEVEGGVEASPPADQYVSPDSPFYSEAAKEAAPQQDLEKAKELYEEYVNDPARSDGKPVGAPVSISYDCIPDPTSSQISQLYQSYWSQLGMEVSLNTVEQAQMINNVIAQDYDITCWRLSDEGDPYFTFKDSFTPGPLNFTAYTSPVIDEQLEVLRTTTDVDERKAAVEEISMDLAESVPQLFTGHALSVIAVDDVVKNVDGWTFPDGTEGNGTPSATTMLSHVWMTE
jgi:peptide/nickel transport system substrate-binding protein